MLKLHRATAVVVIASAFFALSAMAQNPEPEVTVQSESPGWYDVSFPILEEKPIIEDGKRWGVALLIGGVFDGQKVAMALAISDEWEEAKLTPPPPFKSYASSVLFGRVGKSSDRLVRGLANVYRQPSADLIARDEMEFDAISLAKDPRPIGSTPISAKVFVQGKGDEEYGEFYLDVDWKARVVKIKEKDPEYRAAILKAFSGGAR
jgi:hypothetical protein